MKKIRLGLIGCGGIMNGAHIPGYISNENCEVTAICDISDAALKKTGDRLNVPEENRYHDYKDLLASGLIDAVDIATSNDVHVPIAMAALDAGFPVSVEKPIGMNFDGSSTPALTRRLSKIPWTNAVDEPEPPRTRCAPTLGSK